MPVVVDGNSHMYFMLEGSSSIYDADVSKYVDIIRYEAGMNISIQYTESTEEKALNTSRNSFTDSREELKLYDRCLDRFRHNI